MKITTRSPNCLVSSLALSGLVASVLFAAKPAQAASLTYTWSYSGLANTQGTFVADDATGLLSSIAGTVNNSAIQSLLPVTSDNDNTLPSFGNLGLVIFSDVFGTLWSLSFVGTDSDLLESPSISASGTFSYAPAAPTSAVPEPLTILGSITAAGFGVAFKRKKNSTKEE